MNQFSDLSNNFSVPHIPSRETKNLSRQLSNRHIQLISIGGAIGTGLFMGSGKTIALAGPSVLFVYMIIGFMLFLVMRAMGELLLSNLEYKSFANFATELLGPWAGFFTGWTYWFCWIVTGIADVVVISGYISYWLPNLHLWIPAFTSVIVLISLNLPTVRIFGETEFWFALVKIIAIIMLIFIGLIMIFTVHGSSSASQASFSNLWNNGGLFPTGPMGFVSGFQIAIFAFVGIELVGITAAETKDPERNLPKAINSIPVRVMLFYIAALTVIIAVTPWFEIDTKLSPFVAMFSLAGLSVAASIVNVVVLTSATSSANSGIYSTSRMVYGLATEGDAPRIFGKLTSRHVPYNALFLSGLFLLSGVIVVAIGDSILAAFTLVTTIASLCFIFVWTIILMSYLVYRKRQPDLHKLSKFKMPGGTIMCYVVLAFFAFLIVAFALQKDTREAEMITPIWFLILSISWLIICRRTKHIKTTNSYKITAKNNSD